MESVKPVIGMGLTVYGYSDSHAFTVTRVSPSGKTFWAVRDIATLNPAFKPDILPGGFVGHCVNQNEQAYTYVPGTGPEEQFKVGKKKANWRLGIRREFYDYNF